MSNAAAHKGRDARDDALQPAFRDVLEEVLSGPTGPAVTIEKDTLAPVAFYFENMLLGGDGSMFIVGWIDDRADPLEAIDCRAGPSHMSFPTSAQAREYRADLGRLVSDDHQALLGFWCFKSCSDLKLSDDRMVSIHLTMRSGRVLWQTIRAQILGGSSMRTHLLRYNLLAAQSSSSRASGQSSRTELEMFVAQQAPVPGLTRTGAVGFDATDDTVSSQILFRDAEPDQSGGWEPREPRCGVDAFFASADGAMLVVGWIDDSQEKLDFIRVFGPSWEASAAGPLIGRARRRDVEAELGTAAPHSFGAWSLLTGRGPIGLGGDVQVEFTTTDGSSRRLAAANVRTVSTAELRDVSLGYFANCTYHGSPHVEAQAQLDAGLGARIVALNRAVSRRLIANPYVRRFHQARSRPRASLLVCLYGKPEFMFLQAAAFSLLPGFASSYEMVYVSNSPELSERLHNDAQIAHQVYGIDITLVLLSGNAGFGAANNIGVQSCRSDRIVVMNPDVFPRTPDWAEQHLALLNGRPTEEAQLFGVPLFYDDGSMMHAGMYLEIDDGLSWNENGVTSRPMARVEHYGKGAPPETSRHLRSRAVPAVTGAFMSIDREWFEALGGFTEDYVYGHYEDADLCLKSLQRGTPAWLHDAGLLHLEGKGSSRQAAHEGGSIVNRWLFSKQWRAMILDGMQGPEPPRLAEMTRTRLDRSIQPAPVVDEPQPRPPRRVPTDVAPRRRMAAEV
jgi:GT2 family glycosyltransferase